MTVYNHRKLQRPSRSRSLSWYSEDSDEGHPRSLQDEIDDITSSLDTLEDNINSQQFILAKEIEDNVQHVYDGVLQDIKGIRTKVKSISDLISETKRLNLTEGCLTDERDVPQRVIKTNAKTEELKFSRSLTNLDSRLNGLLHTQRSNFRSSVSVSSLSCKTPASAKVQGYGCCFHGDNKIYPYRTHRSKYLCKEDVQKLSFDKNTCNTDPTSRSRSLKEYPDNEGCMRGDITGDWRVKVTPYLWDGWNTPGLHKQEILKHKARLEKLAEFKYDLLYVHNIHRHRHGCPPLIVSDTLSCDAQQWADTLALMGYAQYSEAPDRGENILVVNIEFELTGRQVADTWYREGRFFDYHKPKWQKGSSNFTQMMWKSSREIGIGIAKFPEQNTYIIVAQYHPAGNTNNPGDFWENVPPVIHFESSV